MYHIVFDEIIIKVTVYLNILYKIWTEIAHFSEKWSSDYEVIFLSTD